MKIVQTMTGGGSRQPKEPIRVMHYFSTIEMGGLENYVLTLCENLDPQHVISHITCITDKRPEIVERASKIMVPVHEIPPQPASKIRRRLSYVQRSVELLGLLQRHRIDVLHIHAIGYMGLNAFFAARIAGHPRIVVTHHQRLPRPSSRSHLLVRRQQQHPDARVIVLYEAQGREMEALGIPRNRVRVVPTVVDLQRFIQRDNYTATTSSVFRLCMAARFQEGKGHSYLLEAVASLIGRYPQLRVILIGDGETRSHVEQQIVDLGLSDVVQSLGWVPNSEIPDVLGTMHATILPTHIVTETTPIALIEGMAMGLPAIGTRWGGIPDIIVDGETGLLVQPQDAGSLAAAIEQLVADPVRAMEMGQRARQRAHQIFSGENLAKRMTEVYAELVPRALAVAHR